MRRVLFILNPILFQTASPLVADKYMGGHYKWSHDVLLQSALLTCVPPRAGYITFTLEVAGALTDVSFTVSSSTQVEVVEEITLLQAVAAGSVIRWKVTASTAIDDAAWQASITMHGVPKSFGSVTVQTPALTVVWVNGPERLVLFDYDPATHSFSETVSGISSGRASITRSGDTQLEISLQSILALRCQSDTLYINGLEALGGVAATESPRLEFMVGQTRVATLTKTGVLRIVEIDEADPAVDSHAFGFYSNGSLTANIGVTGLKAKNVEEPI